MTLPPLARARIEEIVSRSGLRERDAAEFRADLEQHLEDGLAAGRPLEALLERFGTADDVAPVVAGLGSQRLAGTSPAPLSATRPTAAGWLAELIRDLRLAARGLLKAPSLVIAATTVLAIGVGVNAVVFTVLNEILLRPLPVDDPSSLVDLWADIPGGNSFLGVSYQDYLAYRAENRTLHEIVAFVGRRVAVGPPESAVDVTAQIVTPGFFDMLGIAPTIGSLGFAAQRFGEPPEVVLSHAFWTEAFGADPGIVGSTLVVDGASATVVGVGPEGFAGHFIGFPSDLWLPVTAAVPLISGFDPDDRGQKPFEMIGRLRPGTSVADAQADLDVVAARIEEAYPELNRGHRVGVTPTTGLDHSLQSGVTAFVVILTTVAVLVLLIACLNVGSILLVRAMSRDREIAIRVALGAGSGRLVRQLVSESLILVTLGSVAGVLVAIQLNAIAADALRVFASGIGLTLSLDWRVLALTIGTALVAAIAASLAPALHVIRKDPAGALRARSGGSGAGGRLRTALVVGQVTVSVVLVTATGLFVRALIAGSNVDTGFDADRVATVVLPGDRLDEGGDRGALLDRLTTEVLALRGVQSVSIANGTPIGVGRTPTPVEVAGVLPPAGEDRWIVDSRRVGAGYLGTIGVALLAGRDIEPGDVRGGAPVAVASEAFMERFRSEGDPLGWSVEVSGVAVQVVGVAADARYIVQDVDPDPILYLSRSDDDAGPVVLTIRAGAPGDLSSDVADVIRSVIPGMPRPPRMRVAREVIDDALLPQKVGSVLIGVMGLAALLLAAVGLYGLIHFTVTRDAHELGVRLALGGGRRDLATIVLRKGFTLAAIGTAAGVVVSLLAAPALGGFLGEVSPADPVTYAMVVACFTVVALIASWIPARRALRIDATEALRGGG